MQSERHTLAKIDVLPASDGPTRSTVVGPDRPERVLVVEDGRKTEI